MSKMIDGLMYSAIDTNAIGIKTSADLHSKIPLMFVVD